MLRLPARLLLCVCVVASLSAPVAVQAQTEEYDRLVLQALEAFDAGNWAEARRLFERAHGLDPTARTLRTIGMAAFNQGDYVAALQNLEAALVDERKPLTDEQRAHVRDLIGQADARVGRYRMTLEPSTARLTVDGKSPALVGEGELLLLPGRHELLLSAEGYATLRRELTVRAGDRAVLELQLSPGEDGAAGEPVVEAEAEPAAEPAAEAAPGELAQPAPVAATAVSLPSSDASYTWGWVALGVGGAALVASGITAGLALDIKSELDDACPDRACPPEWHSRDDEYDAMRLVSGVTLGVGVLGVAVGSVLLLSAGDDDDATAGARLEPLIGPGFAGVRGRL